MMDDRAESDISVVLATYNGEKHLVAQLDSIVSQTLPPREIIVCDDGSTDATEAIVADFSSRTSIPIRFHRNPTRLGYADNFLNGASLAVGKSISFSDQDDIWHPTKLEKSWRVLQDPRVVLVSHPMNLIDESGSLLAEVPAAKEPVSFCGPGKGDPFGVFFGFTMLFEARLLKVLPSAERGPDSYGSNDTLSHDRWIYFLGTSFGWTAVINEPLADYRQHSSQAFGSRPISSWERITNKILAGSARVNLLKSVSARRLEMLEREVPISRQSPSNRWVAEERWHELPAYWKKISKYCRTRDKIYTSSLLIRRLGNWVFLSVRGGYRSEGRGGLGVRHFAEDFFAGALGRITRSVLIKIQDT